MAKKTSTDLQPVLTGSVTQDDVSQYVGSGVVNFLIPAFGGAYLVGALPPELPAVNDYAPFNKQRDIILASTVYVEGMWASAVRIATAKMVARGYQFESDVPLRMARMNDLFSVCDGRRGFAKFLPRHLRDYFTTSNGAWVEIERAGNSPLSPIVSFNHLDSLRVWRTGDPETPAIYWDLRGRYHELRWWECFNIVDSESPRAGFWHGGICAAERAYKSVRRLSAIDIFVDEKITGGGFNEIEFVQGVTVSQIQEAQKQAQEEKAESGVFYFQGKMVIPIFGDQAITGHRVQLKGLPDGWDRKIEDQIGLLRYAKALGIVPQDLDPQLTARGGLGVGTQAQVLDDAERGYGSGDWEKQFTAAVNELICHDGVTFAFVTIDLRDDQQRATNSKLRADARVAQVSAGILTAPQALYMAIQDEDAPKEFLNANASALAASTDGEDVGPMDKPQPQPSNGLREPTAGGSAAQAAKRTNVRGEMEAQGVKIDEKVTDADARTKAWDESKHPRRPEGSADGGEFASNNVSSLSDDNSLPSGLSTKVGADYAGSKTHAWRWAGKDEVDRVLNGKKKYGGEPKTENERGDWFSNAPSNWNGYGKYLLEVGIPVGRSGVGLNAPKNSVGLDEITGIWKHERVWDNAAMDTVDKFIRVYPKPKTKAVDHALALVRESMDEALIVAERVGGK